MPPDSDTRDRVIAMEVQIKNLVYLIEKQADTIEEQGKKVDQLYDLLNKVAGARFLFWVLIGLVSTVPTLVLNWSKLASFFTRQ